MVQIARGTGLDYDYAEIGVCTELIREFEAREAASDDKNIRVLTAAPEGG